MEFNRKRIKVPLEDSLKEIIIHLQTIIKRLEGLYKENIDINDESPIKKIKEAINCLNDALFELERGEEWKKP